MLVCKDVNLQMKVRMLKFRCKKMIDLIFTHFKRKEIVYMMELSQWIAWLMKLITTLGAGVSLAHLS